MFNVLSLFDGISCARVALDRVGIPVAKYYASEVDKYAIEIAQKNYPDIIQIGDVKEIDTKVLRLSGVYDILKEYDSNIQNKFSQWEMLYWLNEDFSISAKIGTQITNADSPESASLQRIEEIRFSRSGVGDIIKTQNLIGSRIVGENGDIETQEILLQCGEWGYVYRSNDRNTQENITGVNGKKTKTGKHRKDTESGTQTMGNATSEKKIIGTDKKGNVETEKSQEISKGSKETKEWGAKKIGNRKEYARSKVQGISFPLQARNVFEAITEREWLQLSIHREMETTVVKTSNSINIFLGKFELICGGSPCQDLSIANKNRKGLDGAKSGLFWEYVRILKEVNPKWFVLENVNSMPKEAKAVITEALGVESIMINAALVSAQNRKRLFWTNIPNVVQPEDRRIFLKDVLEDGVNEMYQVPRGYNKGGIKVGKSPTLSSNSFEHNNKPNGAAVRKQIGHERGVDIRKDGKGNALNSFENQKLVSVKDCVRKLTPIECERLQGLPDNYTEGISNTQRYKCLGNAFNVDVVAHILKSIGDDICMT